MSTQAYSVVEDTTGNEGHLVLELKETLSDEVAKSALEHNPAVVPIIITNDDITVACKYLPKDRCVIISNDGEIRHKTRGGCVVGRHNAIAVAKLYLL